MMSNNNKSTKVPGDYKLFGKFLLQDLNVCDDKELFREAVYFTGKFDGSSGTARVTILHTHYTKTVAPQIEIINDYAVNNGDIAIATALLRESVIRPTLYDAMRDGFEEPQHELYRLKSLSRVTGSILALTHQQASLKRFNGFDEINPEFSRLNPIDQETTIYVFSKNIIQMRRTIEAQTKIGVKKLTDDERSEKVAQWIHMYNAVKYKQQTPEPRLEALYRNELRNAVREWKLTSPELLTFINQGGAEMETVELTGKTRSARVEFNQHRTNTKEGFVKKHGSNKVLRLKKRPRL